MWRAVAVLASATLIGLFAAGQAAGHAGKPSHLWNQHIKPLGDPGTINDPGNPLHWTKLKGVPSGLAQGEFVTEAGYGLKKQFFFGDNFLNVNPTVIQNRVKGSCDPGAISQINQNGSVVCNPIPDVPEGVSQAFYYFDDDVGSIDGETLRSVGALNLPPGQYIVWAKLVITWETDQEVTELVSVICELRVGGDVDVARALEDKDTRHFGRDTLPMMVIGGGDGALQANVLCTDGGGGVDSDAHGSWLKIVAIPVGSVFVDPR